MSFFTKKKRGKTVRGVAREGASALPNPYVNAQRTWNSHVGSLIASRLLWQLTAICSLLIVFVSVAGVIYIGSQSKFVPYVVEVNKLGESVAVRSADKAAPVDSRIVRASVAEFIANARLVTPDVALEKKAILKVYSLMGPGAPASSKMTAFLNGNPEMNPFKRAAKETVSVEIISVIAESPTTWQVDWIETVRTRKGDLVEKPYRMRALVSTEIKPEQPGTNEERMRANPLGIYVTDYSWSKQI